MAGSLLRVWGVALLVSLLVVMAGRRWPGPPPLHLPLVALLTLLPPLLVIAWLVRHWRLPPAG